MNPATSSSNPQAYDLIGDLHGHARELHALLEALGYRRQQGPYAHPERRQVIFLGDYIDRGPQIREVLQTVREMVEGGSALAILGNHEVNALRYHAYDHEGKPLRPHSGGHMRNHQATLDQFPDEQELARWLDWLAGLPLFLDLGALRAVHACWHAESIAALAHLGPLVGTTLENHSVKGTPGHDHLTAIMNGPEGRLPDGYFHVTPDGARRRLFRVKWWEDLTGATCREAIFPFSESIPDLPPLYLPRTGYDADAPPTFFGHYALPDSSPALIRPNLACLDYGLGKGGGLCAYRWDGESQLSESKLVRLNAPPARPEQTNR